MYEYEILPYANMLIDSRLDWKKNVTVLKP